MRLDFLKMQGLGNDFLVFDAAQPARPFLDSNKLRSLADRHTGIGFDQALMLEAPREAHSRVFYRVFNSDGNEVEQCGNGARCFVQFVRSHGLTAKRVIRVETRGGIIEPRLEDDGQVTVDMGVPRLESTEIPFIGGSGALVEPLEVDGACARVSVVSMGNPHAVQVVDNVDDAPVATQGPRIERHSRFPKGVNAGYMQVVDRANIRLRVWERGVGETLACGTGACAAVVSGVRLGLLDSPVRVATRGGALTIAWRGEQSPVFMTGPAATVFEGEWPVSEKE
jgi:diaminopimelate epimerase